MKKLREILGEDVASLEKDLSAYKQRKQSAMQPITSAPKTDFANSPKFQEMRKRSQDFYRQSFGSEPPTSIKGDKPVDFTGSRHSDGKTVSVSDQKTVMPDKPMVGKSDAVGELLKQKGFDRSGKKLNKPADPEFGRETKEKMAKFEKQIDLGFEKVNADLEKLNKPAAKKPESTVASRPVVSQTGFPAAEKPKAPIPKAKPEQSEITIQPKQKIWDIAGGDPNRVKEILKLNPGLNPKKMKVGYKLKLK